MRNEYIGGAWQPAENPESLCASYEGVCQRALDLALMLNRLCTA